MTTRTVCCEIMKNISAAYQLNVITPEIRNTLAELVKEVIRTDNFKNLKDFVALLYPNSNSRYLGNIIDLILKEEAHHDDRDTTQ